MLPHEFDGLFEILFALSSPPDLSSEPTLFVALSASASLSLLGFLDMDSGLDGSMDNMPVDNLPDGDVLSVRSDTIGLQDSLDSFLQVLGA